MRKTGKKPPLQAPSDDVFREFAWNVAGAVHAAKAEGVARPARKPAASR